VPDSAFSASLQDFLDVPDDVRRRFEGPSESVTATAGMVFETESHGRFRLTAVEDGGNGGASGAERAS
jgi:hypothetical protein